MGPPPAHRPSCPCRDGLPCLSRKLTPGLSMHAFCPPTTSAISHQCVVQTMCRSLHLRVCMHHRGSPAPQRNGPLAVFGQARITSLLVSRRAFALLTVLRTAPVTPLLRDIQTSCSSSCGQVRHPDSVADGCDPALPSFVILPMHSAISVSHCSNGIWADSALSIKQEIECIEHSLVCSAADRTHTLQLGADATVADVKSAIQARQGEHMQRTHIKRHHL
jgi:hypothetical protein